MRFLGVLLALALACAPATVGAADAVLTIEGHTLAPASVTMKKGDRLVVVNKSQENHSIWAHARDYAFDFRATDVNTLTHKPGETHAIPMNVPGKYRLGCALHQGMTATVIVEE